MYSPHNNKENYIFLVVFPKEENVDFVDCTTELNI